MPDAAPGRIYRLTLQGQVTEYFGRSGRGPSEFGWIHELACPDAHTLWIAELLAWRVQKLTAEDRRSVAAFPRPMILAEMGAILAKRQDGLMAKGSCQASKHAVSSGECPDWVSDAKLRKTAWTLN